jgi:phage terminase small subunit
MTNELTPKQEAFAQKYVELGNASEAYRQSYDAQNMSPEAIRVEACRLLQHPIVSLTVVNLQDQHRHRHSVTIDRVVAEYVKLAFLDIRKVFDEDGNLKPIHEMDDDTAAAISGLEVEKVISKIVGEDLQSHTHKIKLSDKKGALDSLAKYLGMFNDGVTLNVSTQPLPAQDKALLSEYAKAD